MSVEMRATLLLLLAAVSANAAPEDCGGLKKLATEDLHKIYGDWVLVWSVSDHQRGMDLLPNVSSSHVELRLLPDNNTVSYIERNLYTSNAEMLCDNYFFNMSIASNHTDNHTLHSISATVEKNGTVSPYEEEGAVDFYETCDDCLTIIYESAEGRFLLIYVREGQHQDAVQLIAKHDDHKNMAACLGFAHDNPFSYDGAADFCHKKSSPEVNVEATAVVDLA